MPCSDGDCNVSPLCGQTTDLGSFGLLGVNVNADSSFIMRTGASGLMVCLLLSHVSWWTDILEWWIDQNGHGLLLEKSITQMSLCFWSRSGFKGTVHPKSNSISVIIYSPSSCSKLVWVSFFCWTEKVILKNVGNQTVAGSHWRPYEKKLLWKSVGTSNSLVTNILQNIVFCVEQK